MDNAQDNIITLLGLEDLPLENRAQLVDELTQILEVRVLSAAYDTLSEEQAQHLDTLLNDNDPELVTTYIQENVPTLSDIFANQIEVLKAELVQHKEEITKNLTQELELEHNHDGHNHDHGEEHIHAETAEENSTE
jgi:succinate dehydrogenase flavin-adding protein (antitoxin of CptAB toxin-antitoxin module)